MHTYCQTFLYIHVTGFPEGVLMGVFHWGRLVGNYGFFRAQKQCLQSRLGLVMLSGLVAVERQNNKCIRFFTDPP